MSRRAALRCRCGCQWWWGVQGQGLGGADEAAVVHFCGGVELGVGGGLKAAGVLQKTIHGDGEGALVALSWPALRTPRPCSVPIRVILPAYMPPRAETSRATVGRSPGGRQGGGGVSVQGDGGGAGGGLQGVGPEASVELDGAGNEGGVVGAAAV